MPQGLTSKLFSQVFELECLSDSNKKAVRGSTSLFVVVKFLNTIVTLHNVVNLRLVGYIKRGGEIKSTKSANNITYKGTLIKRC